MPGLRLAHVRAYGLGALAFAFLASCGLEDPTFQLTTGSITVQSDPPGAAISWRGSDIGLCTPATLNLLQPGDHTIKVALPGYAAQPESLVVSVAVADTTLASFALTPIPGSLAVTSTPAGARVVLDGADTGQLTPATLTGLAWGEHEVRVALAGYAATPESLLVTIAADATAHADFALAPIALPATKLVLLEGFSNVNCEPGCRLLNALLHDLMAKEGYGSDRLLLIKYATNWPAAQDPHYLANVADNVARLNYYLSYFEAAGWGIPLLIADGAQVFPADFDTEEKLRAVIDPLFAQQPGLAIRVESSCAGLVVDATITLAPEIDLDLSEYSLNAALVRNPIEYETAPGSTGETVFHDIMRDFTTVLASGPVLTAGTPLVETVALARPEVDLNWPVADLYVIAFLQRNDASHAILQAGSDLPAPAKSLSTLATDRVLPTSPISLGGSTP